MPESNAAAYQHNIEYYSSQLSQQQKKRSRLGWIRLCTIVITAVSGFYFFPINSMITWIILPVGIAIFLFAVAKDSKNNLLIAHLERMLFINNEELSILHFNFHHREDGLAFLPHDHPYAADLDLFGAASLYQYMNRCTGDQSKHILATHLLQVSSMQHVNEVQQAVKELSLQLKWRQLLQAAGMANPFSNITEQKIKNWLKNPSPYIHRIWKWISIVYPVITLCSLLAYVFEIISSPVFSAMVGMYFLVGLSISKKIQPVYSSLTKVVDEIGTLKMQLLHFEKLAVQSSYLSALQNELSRNGKASISITQLQAILNRFDYRLNILVFFLLNSFLLWDLQQLLALNKWKHLHEGDINSWFNIAAQVEVVTTLATLSYNHPAWVYPTIVQEHFTLEAINVGHPLIKENKRVDNSFTTKGTGRVNIITGSNMAGKSTFLRSIGVNMVLAQMGSVVCATSFTYSPVKLYSSMRITDNLAENTSTFYAELKKLKQIIDQVKQHEQVFILLDEILRGTNSLDRHTGSESLVKQLIRERSVAIIATHDVALAELQKSYITTIKNYYFDVQVEGEELYFDYKLKEGICKSMNASILMKKIGIDL